LAGSISLIKPGIYTDLVGLILLAMVIASQRLRKKTPPSPSNEHLNSRQG